MFVRAGAARLRGESGQHHVKAGDVVLVAPSGLCGSEPRGTVTTTTLCVDRDYIADQVYWQNADMLPDRRDAGRIIDAVYADPLQVIHMTNARAAHVAPWLDELVALSTADKETPRFFRMQALLSSVLDVVVPHVRISSSRQSPGQRKTTLPATHRNRQFAPLREEARCIAELIRGAPEHNWTLDESVIHGRGTVHESSGV